MTKDSKKIGYADAMAEVEQIIASMREENLDIDKLAEKVKRAGELIKVCKDRLRKAEEDVAKVLDE